MWNVVVVLLVVLLFSVIETDLCAPKMDLSSAHKFGRTLFVFYQICAQNTQIASFVHKLCAHKMFFCAFGNAPIKRGGRISQ